MRSLLSSDSALNKSTIFGPPLSLYDHISIYYASVILFVPNRIQQLHPNIFQNNCWFEVDFVRTKIIERVFDSANAFFIYGIVYPGTVTITLNKATFRQSFQMTMLLILGHIRQMSSNLIYLLSMFFGSY